MGCLFIFTTSTSVAERINTNNYLFLKRQLFYVVISICIFFFFTFSADFLNIKLIFLMFCIILLMLVGVLFFGFATKGARRWIYIFGFSIQPSEIVKPFLVIINAFILGALRNHNDYIKIFISFIPFGLVCFLVLLQPDIGTLILYSLVYLTQVFLSEIKWKNIIFIAICLTGTVITTYFVLPHVRSRVENFISSIKNENNKNYQVATSIDAYNNAGYLGRGLLEGKMKNFIPDAHTDFVFPAITEEVGFIISWLIISFYLYITLRILLKSQQIKEVSFFKYLALNGLALLFIYQTYINIGVTLHLLPTKGMTLPFLSYGGSSLIGNSIIYAFIINYTKIDFVYKKKLEDLIEINSNI